MDKKDLYQYYYQCGKLSLKDIFDKVSNFELERKDFHWITNYSYEGIKKSRGW